jgi:hypothetical protein
MINEFRTFGTHHIHQSADTKHVFCFRSPRATCHHQLTWLVILNGAQDCSQRIRLSNSRGIIIGRPCFVWLNGYLSSRDKRMQRHALESARNRLLDLTVMCDDDVSYVRYPISSSRDRSLERLPSISALFCCWASELAWCQSVQHFGFCDGAEAKTCAETLGVHNLQRPVGASRRLQNAHRHRVLDPKNIGPQIACKRDLDGGDPASVARWCDGPEWSRFSEATHRRFDCREPCTVLSTECLEELRPFADWDVNGWHYADSR